MLLSNNSYGYAAEYLEDWWFGAYAEISGDWDDLMYAASYYLMVTGAGNYGENNTYNEKPLAGLSEFDKLSGTKTAKNNLVVANVKDVHIASDGSLNGVMINSRSSEGPTDDFRIKPDIAGVGTDIYSATDVSDYSYGTDTGTSRAAPNVTGTLLLLQQYYDNLNGTFMRAATLKGLALHTADDIGLPGPDAISGWGLLNAKAAAETISQNGRSSIIKELTLS